MKGTLRIQMRRSTDYLECSDSDIRAIGCMSATRLHVKWQKGQRKRRGQMLLLLLPDCRTGRRYAGETGRVNLCELLYPGKCICKRMSFQRKPYGKSVEYGTGGIPVIPG